MLTFGYIPKTPQNKTCVCGVLLKPKCSLPVARMHGKIIKKHGMLQILIVILIKCANII